MRVEARDFTTGELTVTEIPDPPNPEPDRGLSADGKLATAFAVLGLLPVADAASLVGLEPDQLVDEAVAWWLASQ